MAIRVLVVDDHKMVREGLQLFLSQEPDLQLVGEATTGQEAISMTDELLPAVVVMDVGLPVMDGIEATRKIRESHPEVQVIALSAHADPYFIDAMKRSGACGYILKDMAFEQLSDAIRECTTGGDCFP